MTSRVSGDDAPKRRGIRSYVLREGRLTRAQSRALDVLWPRLGCTSAEFVRDAHAPFGRVAPLCLEIGIGNGENLVAAAARRPDVDFIGCEVHRPGLGHALLALDRRALTNVRLVNADALELLAEMPNACLGRVWIYFPDPWPKKRHQKRRLVQRALLDTLGRVLTRGGTLRFASDDADYAAAVLALVDATPGWLNLAGPGCHAPRPRERILTRFEQRALVARRAINDVAAANLPSKRREEP